MHKYSIDKHSNCEVQPFAVAIFVLSLFVAYYARNGSLALVASQSAVQCQQIQSADTYQCVDDSGQP